MSKAPPSDEKKLARQMHKRKVKSAQSCIRTDLLPLHPNVGKAAALGHLFLAYREASVEILSIQYARTLKGESLKDAYKGISTSCILHGQSVTLQSAERHTAGLLAGHLNRLCEDFKICVFRAKRMLIDKAEILDEAAKKTRIASIESWSHQLMAINKSHAWMAAKDRRMEPIMKSGKGNIVASDDCYELAAKNFGKAAQRRSLPDASLCQVQMNRGGASLREISLDMPKAAMAALGLSLEGSSKDGAVHGLWLKLNVPKASLDTTPLTQKSIAIPVGRHKGFELRNHGALALGAGGCGPEAYPFHNTPKLPVKGKRLKRQMRDRQSNAMNPASVKPQEVESLEIIQRETSPGKFTYLLGVRTEMADAFKASTQQRQERTVATKIDSIGIDCGLRTAFATSMPVSGSQLHGVGFVPDQVAPILVQAVRLEGIRQAEKEGLIRKAALKLRKANPGMDRKAVKELAKASPEIKRFSISTKASLRLRTRAQGRLSTFVGAFFNSMMAHESPANIVCEKLDFQGSTLSPAVNAMLTNMGRRTFDKKLRDVHEKFGTGVHQVDSAYTSQECSACGYVHAGNRKGDGFLCLHCHYSSHADVNASLCIKGRRPLPSTRSLAKTPDGLSWSKRGQLPRLLQSEWEGLQALGVTFPTLWKHLANLHVQKMAARSGKQNEHQKGVELSPGRSGGEAARPATLPRDPTTESQPA